MIETDRSRNGQTVFCPVCGSEVSGKRFAPHLEKCFRGMKRGSKSSASFAANSLPYDNIKPKKPFIDPFPDSLVVKIKLKNGGMFLCIRVFIITQDKLVIVTLL